MSSNTSAVSSAKPASSSSASKVTSTGSSGRPSLKNLTRARVPRHGLIGCAIAFTAAVGWQVLVSNAHKRDIAAFYKTYDPERDYARLKASGVFKSLESRERPEWVAEYETELDEAIASLRGTVAKAASNLAGSNADDE